MRRSRKSWALVLPLALIAIDVASVSAQPDCDQVVVDAVATYVDVTFDLRRNCLEIRAGGGTCSIQPAERNARREFADAIEASCTAEELLDLGPGGCAAEAEDGVDDFIRCAVRASRADVRAMLAPIFGLGGPTPTPSVPPTPTPRPTCARLNEACVGPGITGCCRPFECRITGSSGAICALPPPPPPSASGAFLDGSPAGF